MSHPFVKGRVRNPAISGREKRPSGQRCVGMRIAHARPNLRIKRASRLLHADCPM